MDLAFLSDVAQDNSHASDPRAANDGFRFSRYAGMERLPDKLLLHVFSFLHKKELGYLARVCKKWRSIAFDNRLWNAISLRPEYNGLHVNNYDALLNIISSRFAPTLRYVELPSDLITPSILHEIANKCPNVKYMMLDFSNAMQLHDFNDLNAFPCNLKSLSICLSEVIFLEGFMRKIYSALSSLQTLQLIGTFELSNEEEEELYEVINISKIKANTPNLRVVNFYGIGFLDDQHVEVLTSNCIHIECLSLAFCLRVKGSSFKSLIQRCKKLRTLILQHTSLVDEHMQAVEWERSVINELDLTSTELSTACLGDILNRMPGFRYLALGYCEFFDDNIMQQLMDGGKFDDLLAIDLNFTYMLSENAIFPFIKKHGGQLHGLMLAGKPKLTENFWLNVIHFLKNIRICSLGTADGWFLKLQSKIHIDQIMECFASYCPKLQRLELQWDPDTLRFSDKSSKFIDRIRIRCPHLKSMALSDGEFYEMVRSNFERADRFKIIRTTTNYNTSVISLLSFYNDLLFN